MDECIAVLVEEIPREPEERRCGSNDRPLRACGVPVVYERSRYTDACVSRACLSSSSYGAACMLSCR